MPYIEWKDEYKIHIDKIDEQHKKLLDIVNEFDQAIEEKREKEIISNTLNSLLEYAKLHFADEEKIMEEYNFPEIENHKKIHQKLVDEIFENINNYVKCKNYNTYELLLFLKEWLIDHIMHEDNKIAKYIIDKNDFAVIPKSN